MKPRGIKNALLVLRRETIEHLKLFDTLEAILNELADANEGLREYNKRLESTLSDIREKEEAAKGVETPTDEHIKWDDPE